MRFASPAQWKALLSGTPKHSAMKPKQGGGLMSLKGMLKDAAELGLGFEDDAEVSALLAATSRPQQPSKKGSKRPRPDGDVPQSAAARKDKKPKKESMGKHHRDAQPPGKSKAYLEQHANNLQARKEHAAIQHKPGSNTAAQLLAAKPNDQKHIHQHSGGRPSGKLQQPPSVSQGKEQQQQQRRPEQQQQQQQQKKKHSKGKQEQQEQHEDASGLQGTLNSSPQGQKQKGQGSGGSSSKRWPFPTDFNDHFETRPEALSDLEPCLALLAKATGKDKGDLVIYDPYYCAGSIESHWASLGYPNVIHRNRDFYGDIESGNIPEYNILVTNPPYSADHKQRIMSFCIDSGKPWALLMPSYVANKSYFTDAVAAMEAGTSAPQHSKSKGSKGKQHQHQQGPFFLVPQQKYEYEHPTGAGHASSPFFSIWFVHLGQHTAQVLSKLQSRLSSQASRSSGQGSNSQGSGGGAGGVRVVTSVAGLQAGGAAPSWKRPNPRQRKKMRAQQQGGAKG